MQSFRDGGDAVIVCGLPGSGKTTRATELEREMGAVRFNADGWMAALGFDLWDEAARARVEALQWSVARRLLEMGAAVVIEWGTWGRSERDTLLEGARALGARVELHYCHAQVETLLERVRARGMEEPPIEREQLEAWAEVFEEPGAEEAALYDRFVDSG